MQRLGRRPLPIAVEPSMTEKLEVVPRNLLNLEYDLREDGVPVGSIVRTPLQVLEKGTVRTEGLEYAIFRESVTRAKYLIRGADGTVRARAERKGSTGAVYRILFDTSDILLKKKVLAGRETYLLTDASAPIGSIVRGSLNSRRMTVELADNASGTPREIILFMVWVVLLIHDRE
jgi:hypothetical protein